MISRCPDTIENLPALFLGQLHVTRAGADTIEIVGLGDDDGAYVREHFFGKYPELKAMVANMSDEDIWRLNRGGHDPHKVYAAYHSAVNHKGQPTVILAKTVKGYGMGAVGEGKNIAHQQKKMPIEALRQFRDRFNVPITDDKLADIPYFKPAEDSPEMKYLRELRAQRGGSLPSRRRKSTRLEVPKLESFKALLDATGGAHHLHLTDADIGFFDSNARLTPPLRSQRDRDAIHAGLFDGTIDAITSDHAPQDQETKRVPFAEAANGALGLETLHDADRQPFNLAAMRRGAAVLFTDPLFMGLTFLGGFGMASFFVFITS